MADPIYTLNVSKLIENVTNDRFPKDQFLEKKLQAALGMDLRRWGWRARVNVPWIFRVIVPIPSD